MCYTFFIEYLQMEDSSTYLAKINKMTTISRHTSNLAKSKKKEDILRKN